MLPGPFQILLLTNILRYFDAGEDNYEESGTVDFSQISIKVSYNVLADGFYAVSDRRIKKDFTRSNTAESLAKLLPAGDGLSLRG